MDLTDRQKQVISVKRLLSDREKRAQIKEWDLEVWTEVTGNRKAHKDIKGAYWCSCPNCGKRKKEGTHYLTGLIYEHRNGDGMGFKCFACKAEHPRVYAFLGKGSAKAEEYAVKRLEIGAVGKGWYCPAPQRHKQQQEQEKQSRAAHHKAKDARRKRENQIAYALREQEELKAAEPKTPSRPKGSCSVSKDEVARERERFSSRPFRRSQEQ